MALNAALLPRPFSSDRPRVTGYEPLIRGKVERVSRAKRNAWRYTVFVDDVGMSFGHCDTKTAAESKCASALNAYAASHYKQV